MEPILYVFIIALTINLSVYLYPIIKKEKHKSIYKFKVGDKITRLKPPGKSKDYSEIGIPVILVGIGNGYIYIRFADLNKDSVYFNTVFRLPLSSHEKGWGYYVDINKMAEETVPENVLEEDIKLAEKQENYELAQKLKNKLDKIRESNNK